MGSLALRDVANASTRELVHRSRAWEPVLGRALTDATILVAEPNDEAFVLGEFQRLEADQTRALVGPWKMILRRGSGGAAARVGPGTLWMQLALSRVDALIPCTPDKILNRYVRPLLRALTRTTSVPTNYFGRDWISAKQHPVALVAFAHEAESGRTLIEAIIAVNSAFHVADRASFLGKVPATLAEVAGRAIDPQKVASAIVAAYQEAATEKTALTEADAHHETTSAGDAIDDATVMHAARDDFPEPEPAWAATREEAIGTIGAGRDAVGRLRIGGELMASRDGIARLEALVASLPPNASADDVGRIVDDTLTSRGAITFGVRSLSSIRDVIVDALRAEI